jgi:hypothetical protein
MAHPNPFDLRHHRPGSDGDLVKQFLSTFGSRKTRRNYRTDLRQFFGEEEVTQQVASQVRKKDLVGFFRERTDSLKRTTIERKVESSRSFFRWLADQNMIEELPIRENLDTGDLVDRIFEEALGTTKEERANERSADAENASRDENGAGERGQNDATRSIREPIPMELERGSEVDSRDETASGDGESSSPRGRPSQDAGDEEPSGPGQNESPSSKTPAPEDRSGGESSETGSANSYSTSSSDGPSEENPAQESAPDEEPGGDRPSEEPPTGEKSTGEDPGEDSPAIPDWAVPSGNAKEVDLRSGERVSLAELPDALCEAFRTVVNAGGAEGLFLRCTDDLAVRIRLTQDQGSVLAHVTIKHRSLTRLAERAGDLPENSALHQTITYLDSRGWVLPKEFYEHVDALLAPADAERPFSDEHPKWSQEDIDNQMTRVFVAAEITGALAQGFGIGKDEKVFLSD